MATTDTSSKLVTLDGLKAAATSSKGYTAEQMAALTEAVEEDLTSHTENTSNPHNVTVSQIGAASASHTHSASDITSGTLPVERGGTGNTTGLAASATKLAASQNIDGVSFDGSASIIHYGTCDTAAATAAKTVSLDGFSLVTGARISVKFTNANSASSPTLNVNSTGAISIMRYGTTTALTYMWNAGAVEDFVYDGTNWIVTNASTATTTYYGLTKLSSSTSSTSTSLAATPSAVKAAYDLADGKADASTSVSATLSASGWTESTDGNGDTYYYQAVTVSGLTASSNGVVGLADGYTAEEYTAAASACMSIYSQTTDSMTIAAYGEKPTVSIGINIVILG